MDLVITPTVAASVDVSLPLAVKIRDILARPAEIRISIQSADYVKERNWLSSRESGAKFQLTIRGKPGFCLAALQNLIGPMRPDTAVLTPNEIFAARVAEMQRWNLRTPWSDLFQRDDMLKFEITGQSHIVTRTFPIKFYEAGPKCSVFITGKPGFAQVAAAQINLNAPMLQRIVAGMLTT